MDTIYFHQGDLPADIETGAMIGIDTETLGLNPLRDALCLVQICCANGEVHLVRMLRPDYHCPRLKALLGDPAVLKIFHYARFDMAMIKQWLGVECGPVWCTKIASKLARTYSDRHGLKDLVREIVGKDISKAQQCSDWGAEELSREQRRYAAEDVVYLSAIRRRMNKMLEREGRRDLAEKCFESLPARVALDLAGWAEQDVFAH